MYRILLVDDEPLVLSGVKFILDWEALDCQIIGTARNGEQALAFIQKNKTDIVLCDIVMPVLNGLELLGRTREVSPATVFIMLTNYSDFEWGREAMRFGASNYLIKNQMDAPSLEAAIKKAQAEYDSRIKLQYAQQAADYFTENKTQLYQNALLQLFEATSIFPESADFLQECGALHHYGAILIQFIPLDQAQSLSEQEQHQHCLWQKEIIESLLQKYFTFADVIFPSKKTRHDILFAFCRDPQNQWSWEESFSLFCKAMQNSGLHITQTQYAIMATDYFSNASQLEECRRQFRTLKNWLYYSGPETCLFRELPPIRWSELSLSSFHHWLENELKTANSAGIRDLFDLALTRIQSIPHTQAQAVRLCNGIRRTIPAASKAASPTLKQQLETFFDSFEIPATSQLHTRTQVISWLETVRDALCGLFEEQAATKIKIAEAAKMYIHDNLECHISIPDVARHLCLSPGYLSTLFKKMCNQNLIDYINQAKINRACELIQSGAYRIHEVSDLLGFENPYYFSRVFKRYMGQSPSEYHKAHTG